MASSMEVDAYVMDVDWEQDVVEARDERDAAVAALQRERRRADDATQRHEAAMAELAASKAKLATRNAELAIRHAELAIRSTQVMV